MRKGENCMDLAGAPHEVRKVRTIGSWIVIELAQMRWRELKNWLSVSTMSRLGN